MTHPSKTALAARTIEQITSGMNSGQAPCLPELVQLIQTLSAKAIEVSVTELADLVQKDVSVMSKVLAAANTIGYNPSGVPIGTVTQAIQVIGFDHIRSLAMSLMLMRHAEDTQSAEEKRQATMLALSSGLVAQSLSQTHGIADPEEAFIAASLRNFGRLLMTAFMTDEYRSALQRAEEIPAEEAFSEVFGLTPLELGRTLLRSANLPKVLLDALRECSPQVLATLNDASKELLVAAELSMQLCELAIDRERSASEFTAATQALADRFRAHIKLTSDDIDNTLAFAGERISIFTHAFGVQGFSRDYVALLRRRAQHMEPVTAPQAAQARKPAQPAPATPQEKRAPAPDAMPAPPDAAATFAVPPPEPVSPESVGPAAPPLEPVVCTPQVWQDGLAQLSDCLAQSTIDYTRVRQQAMECVQAGFGAPEAVFFSIESDLRNFVATHGQGSLFRFLRGDRAIRLDEQTVFGVCLRRRENVVIHRTSDPKTAPYLPKWCHGEQGLGSFVALPLHDQTRCFALLLVGWPAPRQITLTADHTRLLRALLSLVSAAQRLSSRS
ncbi:MAG TPA: HDOD domain-containing protein [Opitutaceae bacterium]|nr:HDOD domain-containing protein [Opitutaceae bacterium]